MVSFKDKGKKLACGSKQAEQINEALKEEASKLILGGWNVVDAGRNPTQ